MKKIILGTILVILLLLTSVNTLAEEYSAKLDIEYEYDSDNNLVTITASVNDIKPKYGVMSVDYSIFFDDSALELVDVNINIPDAWKSNYDEGIVEIDWSRLVEDGHYNWVIFTAEVLDGITEDNQLYVTLEFKPLKSTSTTISFKYNAVACETIIGDQNEFVEISVNSTDVTIDTTKPETPDIEESSMPPVIIDESSSSDNSSFSDNEAPNIDGNISMPGMPVKPNLSEGEDLSVDVSADASEKGSASDYIPWIIIGVGVLGGIAVTVYILKGKKA